ncbi:hypothetical protein D0U04_08800 [Bacillus clarus]|uniref:Uncharacterized protein n=1 Tax=Bacillus clarus TaxID=2338372 RepID=A0A090YU44_9BACI|nr:hypothetical protein [Bacillus clarus]KFN01488.1 hypothetical protein DJ93_1188 [Bacillus clarus]RFT67201.1 hypothetical protein D0U04_08800 [Bacillus clarus]
MNIQGIEKVNVKVVINNHDGSSVECFEKGLKISDSLILSVYENGVEINEFHYDQEDDIVLGDEILGLQGSVNDSGFNLEEISNMNAIEFLLKITTLTKDLH